MTYKNVSCAHCGTTFLQQTGRVNEALKLGRKQYCSRLCYNKNKITSINYVCANCSKKFIRKLSELKKSKSGRSFCSQNCGAIFNNHLRIRYKKPLKTCIAKNCTNLVKDRKCLYCSRKCGAVARKRTVESLKKEILSKIRMFYKHNQRIPVKKEMYDAYRKARDVFGTWNNAIEAAGFKPNPVMFANKYIAKDGHKCDSLAEKIIDEWFRSKSISHERSIPYPEFERMTCDFVVGKFFIEFFGLEGELREYDRLANLKRRLSKKYKFKLIEIKPAHLFPKNKLDQILNFLI